jgi:hypothetical protein
VVGVYQPPPRVSLRKHLHTIRQHTSAYVSRRQNTLSYVSVRQHRACIRGGASRVWQRKYLDKHTSAYVSVAYVSIRQRASAYVSVRQHRACIRGGARVRQHKHLDKHLRLIEELRHRANGRHF